jgi:hypothetical protein
MGRSLLFFLLLPGVLSSAAERYEFFTGVRQMGMGGASVAVANDETSLLANPATLGKLRTYILTVVDPEITGGNDDGPIMGARPVTDMLDPQPLLEQTKVNPGRHWNAKAQIFPSFVNTNFGFGLFAKKEYNAQDDQTTHKFQFDYTSDTAAVLGYSLRLFDGRMKIGVAGRYINRAEAHESFDDTSTNLQLGDFVREGGGIAGDLGVVLTAPWRWLPTLAATWRDAGQTSFKLNNGIFYKNGRYPDDVPQTVDVALAIFPIHSNFIRSTFTVEYQDVLTYSEEKDQFRRYHAGLEVNFYDAFFVRGGMNQRYWTAGLEFAFQHFQLQAASYGEEIGTDTTPLEDRRYIGKLAFRF